MALIEWQPQLSVGIRQFDDDHKKLIALINDLWQANEEREGHTVLDRILGELADYVVYHFQREEELFRRWNFPGEARHRERHQFLTQRVVELRQQLAGQATIAREVFDFLRDWLIKHILGEDMVYASYFRTLGIDDIAAAGQAVPKAASARAMVATAAGASLAGAVLAAASSGWVAGLGVAMSALACAGLAWMGHAVFHADAQDMRDGLKALTIRDFGRSAQSGRGRGHLAEARFYLDVLRGVFEDLDAKSAKSQEILKDAEKEVRGTLLRMSDQLENEITGTVTDVSQRSATLRGIAETMRAQATMVGEQNRAVAGAARKANDNVTEVTAAADTLLGSINRIQTEARKASTIAREATAEVSETAGIIAGLAEASQQIGSIGGMIQSIAQQTNMLALNATIEAARAGEAGRGFAVVAAEVKDLAQQTTSSTQQIETLVSGIREAVARAVDAIAKVDDTIGGLNALSAHIESETEGQAASAAAIHALAKDASSENDIVAVTIKRMAEQSTEAEQLSSIVLNTVGSVSEQVQTMRDRLVATLRNSFAGNRRRHPRIEVDLGSIVVQSGERLSGRVHDLSIGGALVEVESLSLAAGANVRFQPHGFTGELPARVVRLSSKGAHISFELDETAASGLARWIDSLTGSSPAPSAPAPAPDIDGTDEITLF